MVKLGAIYSLCVSVCLSVCLYGSFEESSAVVAEKISLGLVRINYSSTHHARKYF